ncbi:hypothetical protein [Thermofilum sp.]|uniref:hypothetical protein n=1 Tax=Thermofilum sp. TaxID=1961369 RepID=UPI0025878B72|nr:hypothetical protein [Thermofilum sp.]
MTGPTKNLGGRGSPQRSLQSQGRGSPAPALNATPRGNKKTGGWGKDFLGDPATPWINLARGREC